MSFFAHQRSSLVNANALVIFEVDRKVYTHPSRMTTVSEKNEADKESANNEHENGKAQDNQNADADVIQTTINEEDLIDGLDIVDAWDDEDQPRRRSWDRTRGRERRTSRYQYCRLQLI